MTVTLTLTLTLALSTEQAQAALEAAAGDSALAIEYLFGDD